MNPTAAGRERIPCAVTTAAWGLGAVFLLAACSPNLQACDGGTAVPNPGNNPGLVADCKILLAVRDELAGTGSLNWDTRLAITDWQGIRVSRTPSRVTVLDLDEIPLTGTIPVGLSRLSKLERLSLGGTQLTGTIPIELAQLSQLRELELIGNRLTGPIPTELSRLSKLERLSLSGSQLTETIPIELAHLHRLGSLYLDHNQLTGTIPVELSQLSGLQVLDLSNNQLTGTVPVELSRLSKLSYLNLSGNQLTGEIRMDPPRLPRLSILDLSDNQLTETIPVELIQYGRHLQRLDLSGNQLTGTIPAELGQLSQLLWLSLHHNQLTGTIPAELGQLSRLDGLFLNQNQLTGTIPVELGQLSRLYLLHLQHNQLTGTIPAELGQLSQLRAFSFRGNRLTGPVPTPLNHLPDVYVLNLAASWVSPSQMKATWDDAGDPTASYEYRFWDPVQTWGEWAEIADPETMLRVSEGKTIEWTLTVLPTNSELRMRIVYTAIGIRARNRKGYSPEAIAELRPLEASGTTARWPVYVPYCRNQIGLWYGSPACTTTAVLPQVVMGPLGENIAQTEIILTNRDPRHPSCEVGLLFHQGTSEGPEVSFNDPDAQLVGHNLLQTSLSRGGARIFTLTPADAEQLVVGAVWVFVQSPCSVDSLQVQGRYLLENRIDGEIEEIFSVSSQSPQEWLGDGDCQVLTGIFGPGRDVGFASVTREPEQGAPVGTWLHFRSFDLEGNLTGNPPSLEISGGHNASFPWSFEEPTIIEMCLEVPETDSDFYLSTLAVGVMQTGIKQQWSDEIFVDSFPSAQPSAWSETVP